MGSHEAFDSPARFALEENVTGSVGRLLDESNPKSPARPCHSHEWSPGGPSSLQGSACAAPYLIGDLRETTYRTPPQHQQNNNT